MASLSGPHPISGQLQVKIPVKLARRLRLKGGDEIFWRISDDDPDCLILVPSEVIERRYGAGERLEASARSAAQELVEDL
jgi:hypothetical protein